MGRWCSRLLRAIQEEGQETCLRDALNSAAALDLKKARCFNQETMLSTTSLWFIAPHFQRGPRATDALAPTSTRIENPYKKSYGLINARICGIATLAPKCPFTDTHLGVGDGLFEGFLVLSGLGLKCRM